MYKIRLNKVRKSFPKNYSLNVQCLNGNVKMQSSPLGFDRASWSSAFTSLIAAPSWWLASSSAFAVVRAWNIHITLLQGHSHRLSDFFSLLFKQEIFMNQVLCYRTTIYRKNPLNLINSKRTIFTSSLTAITFAISFTSEEEYINFLIVLINYQRFSFLNVRLCAEQSFAIFDKNSFCLIITGHTVNRTLYTRKILLIPQSFILLAKGFRRKFVITQ